MSLAQQLYILTTFGFYICISQKRDFAGTGAVRREGRLRGNWGSLLSSLVVRNENSGLS